MAGIGVRVAARVGAVAAPVPPARRSDRDLAAGSGLELSSRGAHDLRGIAEPSELCELISG